MLPPISTGNVSGFEADNAVSLVNGADEDKLYTVDDLLVNRAFTSPDTLVLGYPASARGRSDYVYYSNKDLDRFADEAARNLLSLGMVENVSILRLALKMMFELTSMSLPDFRYRMCGGDSGAVKPRLCDINLCYSPTGPHSASAFESSSH